jgi:hypothetical protein
MPIVFKPKIHRATVPESNRNYILTIQQFSLLWGTFESPSICPYTRLRGTFLLITHYSLLIT